MGELGGCFDLPLEGCLPLGIGIVVRRAHHLQRDQASHQDVFGLVNATHTAAAEGVEDAVLPQPQPALVTCEELFGLIPGE